MTDEIIRIWIREGEEEKSLSSYPIGKATELVDGSTFVAAEYKKTSKTQRTCWPPCHYTEWEVRGTKYE